MIVTARTQDRSAWIDFAVAHPRIGFTFYEPPKASPVARPAGEHLGLAISQVKLGKRKGYEVAEDVAGHYSFAGDNGDLEDALRERFPEIDQDTLSSESDTLILRGQTREDVQSLIDRVDRMLRRG